MKKIEDVRRQDKKKKKDCEFDRPAAYYTLFQFQSTVMQEKPNPFPSLWCALLCPVQKRHFQANINLLLHNVKTTFIPYF